MFFIDYSMCRSSGLQIIDMLIIDNRFILKDTYWQRHVMNDENDSKGTRDYNIWFELVKNAWFES